MRCKNCDSEIQEKNNFCNNCGARQIRNRLTLRNLFEHFNETFLNYDNKFFKTIIKLITDPVDVIDGYINGVRKKYMSPLGFFAIILSISGFYMLFIQTYAPDLMNLESFYNSELQQKFTDEAMKIMIEYNSVMYSVLIPLITLMSFVVFIDKSYNFTEHLVMYIYTMSLFSISSIVVNLVLLPLIPDQFLMISVGLYILFLIYQSIVLIKIFKLTTGQFIMKTLIFLPIFVIAYVAFSIMLFIVVIIFGDISLQDFRPPS